MLSETWQLIESRAASAAENMAMDEALLISAATRGQPVLRFYAWTEAAASFGYFQKYSDIAKLTPLRPLVRRPTGGGLVPHTADWTYSLAFPPQHPWHGLRAIESYRQLHAWIQAAFQQTGLPTELAPAARAGGGQCFAGAEQFDVLWASHKIAGAAQRRNRLGLLIQGSAQPPAQFAHLRSRWEQALRECAQEQWHVHWENWRPDAQLEALVQELVRTKYSLASYNQRR